MPPARGPPRGTRGVTLKQGWAPAAPWGTRLPLALLGCCRGELAGFSSVIAASLLTFLPSLPFQVTQG